MPKPSREMVRTQPSLYQVQVDCRGETLLVGPKVQQIQVAEQFCEAIGMQIAKGLEQTWSNPQIVEFKAEESSEPRDTRTLGDLIRQSS